MDSEKLIALVQQHAALWDPKHKSYHNRVIIKRLWKKVALEMNEKEETVRQKWRGLRDTFRKEVYKANSTRSVADAALEKHTKWQFYNNMLFLKDHFQPRPVAIVNISSSINTNQHIEEPPQYDLQVKHEYEDDFSCANEQSTSAYESPETLNPNKKTKTIRDDAIEKLLLLENQKHDDDDYHFAMSIVPYMRKVPFKRKLQLRTKIQQLIMEEQQCEVPSEQ